MDWVGKKVTVTGAAGFLGSHLCEALIAKGAEVIALDNFDVGSTSNIDGFKDKMQIVNCDITKDDIRKYTVFDLSAKLRERGWIISAYTMPPNAEEIAIMRVVVREHFSRDMAEILFEDTMKACDFLQKAGGTTEAPEETSGKGKKKHHTC